MKIPRDKLKEWTKDLRAASKALILYEARIYDDGGDNYDDTAERIVRSVIEEMEAEL